MRDAVRCVAPVGDWCGEGVLWHSDEQAVYWTDINRFLVHRWNSESNAVRSWFFDEPVTTVVRTSRPQVLLLVIGSGTLFWEPATDTRRPGPFRLPGWPEVRCNDAAADPAGALWVGSMRNNVRVDGTAGEAGGKDGKLFRVIGTGDADVRQQEIGIANTLVWSPDGATLYFGDSLANALWKFSYNGRSGLIADKQRFFCDFERGSPDGSAIDRDGYVWNCRYGGACIVRVAPSGEVDRVVELPVSNATNCTFGGPSMSTLFITTAAIKMPSERLAGSLFALETEVAGLPDGVFQIPA